MKKLYYISFLPGLETPVQQMLKKSGGVSTERMLEGGALFRANRAPALSFARRCFLVLFQMKPCQAPEEALRRLLSAGEWLNALPYEEIGGKRFRITVSDGEKKMSANMRYVSLLEKAIEEHTGMRVSREKPECEFWILLRKEAAYFLLRIPLLRAEEKRKMRPDVAGTAALLLGYDPGAVALLGTADEALVRMLLEQGARPVLCIGGKDGDPDAPRLCREGVRLLQGSAQHTDLEEKSCRGACLFLSGRTDPASAEVRGALHEAARILAPKGTLVFIAPQSAFSVVERNRTLREEQRYFCEWGGSRMGIAKLIRTVPEEV